MNQDILKGKWMQLKGELKSRWGHLTDDEIDQIEGNADKLAGVIQERYGRSREQAEREIDEWLHSHERIRA